MGRSQVPIYRNLLPPPDGMLNKNEAGTQFQSDLQARCGGLGYVRRSWALKGFAMRGPAGNNEALVAFGENVSRLAHMLASCKR